MKNFYLMFQFVMDENDIDINDLDASEIDVILDKKVGKLFGACSISFTTINDPHFKDFVKTFLKLNPNKIDYKLPDRKTLSKTIIPAVLNDLNIEKKRLLDGTISILLMDGWKNKIINRHFLVFTLRTLKMDQMFLTFVDNSKKCEDGDTVSEHIVEAVQLALAEYNTQVVGIITDNDNKVKCGARMASEKLIERNINADGLIQATCYSHSGNLLIKSIIEEDFLKQLRLIITAFSSSKLSEMIIELGGTQLKNYPDTRFCYIRYTCESIVRNLCALRDIAEREHISEDVQQLLSSDDFERKLLGTIRTVDPICSLINNCQSPRVNIADGTEQWLSLHLNTREFDEIVQNRISSAIPAVGYAANLMHQRYRGNRLDDDQAEKGINFLFDSLDEEGRDELEIYLQNMDEEDVIANSCTDAMAYWHIKELIYPSLAKFCIKIMLIPASTALLEGLFSQWTHTHTKPRNSLSNATSGRLIQIYHISKHLDKGIWKNTVSGKKRKIFEVEDYQ